MRPRTSPPTAPPSFLGAGLVGEFESPSALFFLSSLFLQSGGMDLSRVGERLLSSVRSARSLSILPSAPPDRPEVPARAAAAAAVARALAGLPPHQRFNLPSSSEELVSIYGSRPSCQDTTDELEEDFYEEDFDPVKHVLDSMPSEGSDLTYFEEKATLRLAQLDLIAERLARHVMEHHEEMVKGMQLVRELEQDLKIANVICMNGRRHLTSSMTEVSRDLVVHSSAKKKQVLLDMLPILADLHHAVDMRMELEILVEEGNYFGAFQVFSEYLQVLDSLSGLSVVQELSQGVEDWLSKTLQKLDSLLLGVCQNFNDVNYLTAIDAYAIIGDSAGLAEKIQSFFMQEVLSETHTVLKDSLQEDIGQNVQKNRFTYSDLCARIPESKFRLCLLSTLSVLFKLMCSYYAIMSFEPEEIHLDYPSSNTKVKHETDSESFGGYPAPQNGITSRTDRFEFTNLIEGTPATSSSVAGTNPKDMGETSMASEKSVYEDGDYVVTLPSSSPFYQLRKEATKSVARTLERGRRNVWQLTTSRVTVLLSCSAVCSTSTHQFLRNYEDLKVFILAGEAFCGVEAVDFRQRLKQVCETYLSAFHRQNIYALKMVLEKETWVKISSDAMQAISLAGLVGDGAALITPVSMASLSLPQSKKNSLEHGQQKNGFAHWLKSENPFSTRSTSPKGGSVTSNLPNGTGLNLSDRKTIDVLQSPDKPSGSQNSPLRNSSNLEDENEDLLADFIDEDSQLPGRNPRTECSPSTSHWNDEDISTQTGSSICLLRLMDKYARLMQKLEVVNVEFFKGITQLFGIFFHFIFETFGQRDTNLNGKVQWDSPTYRLKLALARIAQDCDQWIKQQNLSSSPPSSSPFSASFSQIDVTPTIPASTIFGHSPNATLGLKERCAAAETIQLVARMLLRSRAHIQSMLSQSNVAVIEDFFETLVDSVPDLIEFIHRTTARMLLNINGYADRVANAKWEVKELGIEHNGYVDLLLGEFKHYKTRLVHSGIHKEVQDLLLVYGLENVADILVEGLSRVKKCTDEGRALMSLDLQVLINGMQHFVPVNVKPKLQVVETFIKAYYLPETEYVHWARSHQEYSKTQITGLVNLVAAMKSWKRKTRLEVIERIEAGN